MSDDDRIYYSHAVSSVSLTTRGSVITPAHIVSREEIGGDVGYWVEYADGSPNGWVRADRIRTRSN